MATLQLRDIRLNQTAITGRRNPNVTVTDTRARYKINTETQEKTDEIEGYSIDIIALQGKPQTVKLPLTSAETVEKIRSALKSNKIVTVDFGTPSTLHGKLYAMYRNNQLLSGVTCSAEIINVVKIEDIDDDYDDLVEI